MQKQREWNKDPSQEKKGKQLSEVSVVNTGPTYPLKLDETNLL